jgi:hypothetical protein
VVALDDLRGVLDAVDGEDRRERLGLLLLPLVLEPEQQRRLVGVERGDDDVGLDGRELLEVDLAVDLAERLDAAEVDALEQRALLQRAAGDDPDGLDAR